MTEVGRSYQAMKVLFLVLVCCGIFFFLANYLFVGDDSKIIKKQLTSGVPSPNISKEGSFDVDTPGCRIPNLDPFDDSVKIFIRNETLRHQCVDKRPPLVDSNLTSVFLVNESKIYYVFNESEEIVCCYRWFWRVQPEFGDKDNIQANFSNVCVEFRVSAAIHHEFVEVSCKKRDKNIYKGYFSFVPRKELEEPKWTRKPLNVLILGIDSMSRMNFLRQMPKTARVLDEIRAYKFVGLNKLGDNTFPNLIPMLTGSTEEEIYHKCWEQSHFCDKCDYIWKSYRKLGFATVFAEDGGKAATFYYKKSGFRKQPTDYDYHFFNSIAEEGIGSPSKLIKLCLGARYIYDEMLKYVRKFVESFRSLKRPYFAFIWCNSISHDYLNRPRIADEDYAKTIRDLYEEGFLNDTIFITLSDHGNRFSEISNTEQGMLEARLPFLYVKLPEWYQGEHPQLIRNMEANTRRLVTFFDLHETLKDFLNPHAVFHRKSGRIKRGYSLFEEIPNTRSCKDAAIADHWCSCQSNITEDVDRATAQKGAAYAIDYLNLKLSFFPKCAMLQLSTVLRAKNRKQYTKNGLIVNNYMINLNTTPNSAIYEATLIYYKARNGLELFDISGTISRLNMYSHQSECIYDVKMKLYCFCMNATKIITV